MSWFWSLLRNNNIPEKFKFSEDSVQEKAAMDFPEISNFFYLSSEPLDERAAHYFQAQHNTAFSSHLSRLLNDFKEFDFSNFQGDYIALDHWIERMENFVMEYNSNNIVSGYNVEIDVARNVEVTICEEEHVNLPHWIENLPLFHQNQIIHNMFRIIEIYKEFCDTGDFSSFWLHKPMLKRSVYILKCKYHQFFPLLHDSGNSSEAMDEPEEADDQEEEEESPMDGNVDFPLTPPPSSSSDSSN